MFIFHYINISINFYKIIKFKKVKEKDIYILSNQIIPKIYFKLPYKF